MNEVLRPPYNRFFPLEEMEESDTAVRWGIDNTLPEALYPNMQCLMTNLGRIRTFLNEPIIVTSAYRCLKLNRKLGSKDSSDHVQALAADIKCNKYTALDLCRIIFGLDKPINWDQIIHEYGRWCHLSVRPDGVVGRRELWTIRPGSKKYERGLLWV